MAASIPRSKSATSRAVRLDVLHATIVDVVCAADRRREDAGKPAWTRLATDHELCPPGGPCGPFPSTISVVVVAPGIRMRRAAAFGMVAV